MKLQIFGKDIINYQRFEEKAPLGDTGRPKGFSKELNYQTLYRTRQDILSWRNAVKQAESYHNPNRTNYYRLLKDVVLDNHLSAVIMQRKNAILGLDFCLYNDSEVEDEEREKLLEKDWFYRLLDKILDAKFYGFTLIDLGELIDMEFNNSIVVPREYVKPELNIVVKNTGDLTGIPINDPKYKKWNLYVCEDPYDLGILLKAAPLVLWKKNALAFWSEHTEKYAQPMRIGKTNTSDEKLLSNMEAAMSNMGSSFWAVLDQSDEFQLLNANYGNANTIYENLVSVVNSELSKLILGQTGTTDEKSFVGSANVHKGVLNDIIESDKRFLESVANRLVLPVLNMHGFGLDGLKFKFKYKEVVSKLEKAEIDAKFMPYVKYDKDYLEETYDIKLSEEPMEVGSEKKSLTNYQNITDNFQCKKIDELYKSNCEFCYTNEIEPEILNLFSEEEKQQFIDGIESGLYDRENLPQWMYEKIYNALILQVALSWGYKSLEEALTGVDGGTFKEFVDNIKAFAAAKVFQLVDSIMKLPTSELKTKGVEEFNTYNETYLNSEYTTAFLIGQQAYNWIKNIEANKDVFGLLRYDTKKDDRVRPSHQTLEGIIKPVSDSFWNVYYPPNGWACRCVVSQLQGGKVTNTKDFKNPDDVLDYFLFNPGKDKMIFSNEHPYFDVPNKYKKLALNNFNLPM